MKHNFNKILSILLVVIMCLSAFPMYALAAEATVICPECYKSDNINKLEVALTPTCTAPAGTWYECGNKHGEDGIVHRFIIQTAPAFHSNETKVTKTDAKPATHTEAGNSEYWTCNECGKYYSNFPCTNEIEKDSWIIPANSDAHDWPDDWQVEKNFVCGGEDGVAYRVCQDPACGKKETKPIEAPDHNWVISTEGLENISCLVSVKVTFVCNNKGCTAEPKEVDGYGWAHELVETKAQDKTCTDNGNLQYFTCRQCNKVYADANATNEVTDLSTLVIPASHDADQTFPAVEAGCLIEAKREYYKCDCGVYFYVESGAQIVLEDGEADADIIIGAAHTPTFVPAVASDCTTPGNIAHWTCTLCGKNYEGTEDAITIVDGAYVELGSVVDAADGHDMTHHEEVVGGCTAEEDKQIAYFEYWSCSVCEKNFADEAGDTELEETRKPITVPDPEGSDQTVEVDPDSELYNKYAGVQHNWNCSELEAATCTKTGARAWTCSDCGAFNGFGKTIVYEIPSIDHKNAEIIDKVEPTCTTKGTPAYASCPDCGRYLAVAEDGETIIKTYTYDEEYINANVIDSIEKDETAHSPLAVVQAKDPTCFEDGNEEYYICALCDEYFTENEDGSYTNTDVAAGGFAGLIAGLVPEQYVIPAHTQTPVELDASENCQDKGYKAHWACSCGNLYAADELGAIVTETAYTDVEEFAYYADHDYGTLVDATYTCGEDGYDAHYQCSVCETYFDAEKVETTWDDLFVEATGEHDTYIDVEMVPCVGENDHGVAGIELCHGCHTYSKIIDQHDYSVKVYVVDPTCTTLGQYKLECSRCGVFKLNEENEHLVKTEEVARPHSDYGYTYHAAVPSTCVGGLTDGNYAYYECNKCHGKFKNANMTEAYEGTAWVDVAKHTPVAYSTTATECGGAYAVNQYKCDVCGLYSMTEDFAVSQETPYTSTLEGHTVALEVAVAADPSDCTVHGTKEILHCAGECGKYYVDGVEYADLDAAKAAAELPLLPHDGYDAGFDATCTKEGENAHYECTMCGKFYAVIVVDGENVAGEEITVDKLPIAKINHSSVKFVEENIPHCTDRDTVITGNIAYYVCSCGARFTTETAAPDATPLKDEDILLTHVPNHVKDTEKSKAPACEKYGYNIFACDCGYEYVEFVAPLLHNVTLWDDEAVEPSCSENGKLEFYYCEHCKQSYADADCKTPLFNANGEVIDSLDKAVLLATGVHTNAAGEVITEGCDENKDYVCVWGDRCDKYDADTEKADLRIDHDYVEGSTTANCTTPASTFEVCKVCGYHKPGSDKTWGEKNGVHPENALIWVEVTPATCDAKGTEKQHCELCDTDTGVTRDIPENGHNFDKKADGSNWVITEAEDCTETGLIVKTCQNGCGKTENEVLPAGNHNMTDWAYADGVNDANAYTKEVAQERHCTKCDKRETRSMEDILFTIDVDNAVVSDAGYVNSGKIAVKINVSAYKQTSVLNAFTLKFNYENLTYAGIDYGTFADKFAWKDVNAADGTFTIMVMPATLTDVDVDGQDVEFITVYFNIDADAPTATKNSFTVNGLEIVECINAAGDDVTNTTCGAGVTETYGMLGDVDGNGEITLRDAQLIMEIFQGTGNVTYSASADFDKNGSVQVADFAAIRKYISGAYSYEMLVNPELRPAS